MPRLTIREIAKLAGVSTSAVSIVLNNRKGVSEDTRKKVTDIVDKLQYTPNPNSRRLLLNKTGNISVLFKKNVSPLEHFFYSELNRVILHECESSGYNLIFSSYYIEGNSVILPAVIRSYDVDGILFYGDIEQTLAASIKQYEIPYVILDSHICPPETTFVSADYSIAAYTATKYLINMGHEKIGFIGTNSLPQFGIQTFNGFKRAIEENNISVPLHWLQMDAYDEETAALCMKNILTGTNSPTAVFCSADIYAIGAMRQIKKHGLNIPEDISIIGIDNIILSGYLEPPLTTIHIDKEAMGKKGMALLMKKINKEIPENVIIASDNLVPRKSVRKAGEQF